MAALALEVEHAIDHVLEHAGARDLPFLGDVATSTSTVPVRLARRISSWAEPRTWATVPGAESRVSRYMVWMESITTMSGGVPSFHARRDIADVDGRGEPYRRTGETEPDGAHTDLLQALLARYVGDPPAAPGQSGGGL